MSAVERIRIDRYEPTAIEPRWQQRWAELRLSDTDLSRHHQAQVLPPDDVRLPVGQPPHRALVRQDPDGRPGTFSSHARRERLHADRLRRVRAAGRKRRDQEQRQPPRMDTEEHRQDAPAAPVDGRLVRLERRGRHLRARVLPLEPVAVPEVPGSGSGLSHQLTRGLVPQRRDAGARAGRGRRIATAGAAAPTSRSASSTSGICASPNTPTSCSTSRASNGRSRSASCRPTGSADPKAPKSSSRQRAGRTSSPAATSCASSRPGRTRCTARPSWSCRPSTRSSPS